MPLLKNTFLLIFVACFSCVLTGQTTWMSDIGRRNGRPEIYACKDKIVDKFILINSFPEP